MIKLQPELSRPIEVSRITPADAVENIGADPRECALIARRLNLPAIHALKATLHLSRWRAEGARVTGRIEAEIDQICVVTLDQFRTEISEEIERYFLPDLGNVTDDADVDVIENGVIELGEIVVEGLSLALDPYPRKPGAVLQPAGDGRDEPDARARSPFAALAALRTGKC